MAVLGVVVPTYNVEKYIDECLSSFVKQTSKGFHVYIIDDGSTDKSSEIAKGYANKYPDLFSYHYQVNKGLGGARNTGLNLVKEEYVWFFDSDDFTGPRSVEEIIKYYQNNKPQILLLTPTIFDNVNKDYWEWYDAKFVKEAFKSKDIINVINHPELLTFEANFNREIWNKKFLLDNHFHFIEGTRWEDIYPHFYLFSIASSIGHLDNIATYYYRVNTPNQITSGTGATRLELVPVFKNVVDLAKRDNWNISMWSYLVRTIQNYTIWTLKIIDKNIKKEFIKQMHDVYRLLNIKHLRAYKNLPSIYNHKRKKYVLAKIIRGKISYRLLYHEQIVHLLNKLWSILRRIKNIVRKNND